MLPFYDNTQRFLETETMVVSLKKAFANSTSCISVYCGMSVRCMPLPNTEIDEHRLDSLICLLSKSSGDMPSNWNC